MPAYTIDGDVSSSATVSGSLRQVAVSANAYLSGTATVAGSFVVSAGSSLATSVRDIAARRVRGQAVVSGALTVTRRYNSLPTASFASLGYLPSRGVFAYLVDGTSDSDVAARGVPIGGDFLVTAIFPDISDAFRTSGAVPGSVGTRVASGVYSFRAPTAQEVVWHTPIVSGAVTDGGLYRFDGTVWRPYKTRPERGLSGQMFAENTDPDGVYRFYARMVGFMFVAWYRDTLSAMDLLDPLTAPARVLPLIAQQWRVNISHLTDEGAKRQYLRTILQSARLRGLARYIEALLRHRGYDGYAREIWVNPEHGDNWTVLSAAPDDVQSHVAIEEQTVRAESGEKGQDWIVRPHGKDGALPSTYWPSSAFGIHLRRRNGGPVALPMDNASVRDFINQINAELRAHALPASFTVRYYATDLAPSGTPDILRVSDTLAVSNIAGVPYRISGEIAAGSQVLGSVTADTVSTGSIASTATISGNVPNSLLGSIVSTATVSGNFIDA